MTVATEQMRLLCHDGALIAHMNAEAAAQCDDPLDACRFVRQASIGVRQAERWAMGVVEPDGWVANGR